MTDVIALCMKCKHNEDMEDKKAMDNLTIEEKDGRYSARGECPDCGTGMFKFLSKDDAEKLKAEQ